MSAEHILNLYAERTEEIIERFRQMFPSCEHKVYDDGIHWLSAERIVAFLHPKSQREIDWFAEDYGVRVNQALSFRYYSDADVNSAADILSVIRTWVRDTDSDLLFRPNGDEPILIRRGGILNTTEAFDRQFGAGAAERLRAENRIVTENLTMKAIMERCEQRFGEDFNWWMLPPDMQAGTFVTELKKELGEDDPFFADPVEAVWKCDANDDMLFCSTDGAGHECWRIYHLTWAGRREREGFPLRWDFESGQAAAEYIINQFITENTE
ncbi:MAG: hypothetical protein IK130_11155 [Oscillospiraceae bacterium]|nr:hypothetical protein [Oscillospiraceae bacterium]